MCPESHTFLVALILNDSFGQVWSLVGLEACAIIVSVVTLKPVALDSAIRETKPYIILNTDRSFQS